jgi:HAMP domain-containing protein
MFKWQRAAAVRWSGIGSPLLKSVLIALNSRFALRVWAAVALPGAAALASLIYIQAHHQALAAAGADIGFFQTFLAGALIVGALLALLLTRSVTKPLKDLTEATRSLAKGDLGVQIPSMERADELGELARAVLVFQEQSLAVERIAGARELAPRTSPTGAPPWSAWRKISKARPPPRSAASPRKASGSTRPPRAWPAAPSWWRKTPSASPPPPNRA